MDAPAVAVGHYANLMPASAERAVDAAMSGAGFDDIDRHLVRRQTQMGLIRGAVGDVDLFPWMGPSRRTPRRVALLAGMGEPGTFGPRELVTVARNVATVAGSLPGVAALAMVMIGSGAGNMTVEQTVRGLVTGLAEATGPSGPGSSLREVVLVERELGRAREIERHLTAATATVGPGAVSLHFDGLERGPGQGTVSVEYAAALALAGMVRLGGTEGGRARRLILSSAAAAERRMGVTTDQLAARLEVLPERLGLVKAGGRGHGVGDIARRMRIDTTDSGARNARNPARLSYLLEGGEVVVSAIGDTATVAKRALGLDAALLASVVAQTSQPGNDVDIADACEQIASVLVHHDLRGVLRSAAQVVFEVDRNTAAVPWELVDGGAEGPGREPVPLGLVAEVSRQLRTEYSPAPAAATALGQVLSVLVIGDPGDPGRGHDLPGARREAVAVRDLLHGRVVAGRTVEVDLLLGAPADGQLPEEAVPATRYEVLRRLRSVPYDLVHYCGHGAFEQDDPSRQAGWVFADGLLTARQLQMVHRPPRLVVANACHSGRLSVRGGPSPLDSRDLDRLLLPAVVDEFLRQGVRDHIGAAWEVDDEAAISFAVTLYEALLSGTGEPATMGAAVLAARRAVAEQGAATWAAYQHYGHPVTRLVPAQD